MTEKSNQQPDADKGKQKPERDLQTWFNNLFDRPAPKPLEPLPPSEAGNRTERFTADYIPGGGSQSEE